jgi:urease accessory protein
MELSASTGVAETFAATRARGRVELSVLAARGATRLARVREEGSLRVRFPSAPRGAAEAVLLNTAGGMASGDHFGVAIQVGEDAALSATTAAAEKIYRSLGPATEMEVALTVEAGATLWWLPQETIQFHRARLDRAITADVADRGRLCIAEAAVFGRAAMGETVAAGAFFDRWRVRRGGRLVYAEGVRLQGGVGAAMQRSACGGGAAAMATVLMVPGDDCMIAAVRAREPAFLGEVGASAWNGIAAVRLLARQASWLRHDLAIVLTALGVPLPRLWLS